MTETSNAQTERAVFQELLGMPLRAIQAATFAGLLAIALIYVALADDGNRLAMSLWAGVAGLTRLACTLHARHRTQNSYTPAMTQRLLLELRLLYAFEGATWGTLPWITFPTCSVLGNVLAISVILGVCASRMLQLSPVYPVFQSFILAGGLIATPRTLFYEGVPYHAIGLGGVIFVIVLLRQARVHSHTLETSVRLRFEKQALLEELNAQMVQVDAARELADAARRKAEDANRAKSKFLAAASHDLRQPAQAQGLFLEVLSRTPLNAAQHKLLDNVRAASAASSEMLNILLDFSRIEAGVITPRLQPFALQTLLHKMEHEFGPQADASELIYRTRETALVVHSDPALVELILRNLVSNALRYTRCGGVLVACRQRGAQVLLEVWDTGIGIAAAQQQDVFREFLQLGNPERDRQKGLGLGLAIANGLAQRLGHALTLHSREGRGSVFRLALPLSSAHPIMVITAAESPTNPCHARVLVIDDDDAVRSALQHLLRDWGCQCDAASSVKEALVLAQQNAPAVVISDYRLRGTETGADAIRTLRARLGETLPALLITGDTAPERLVEATQSGIPLLHKPVAAAELQRMLRALLAAKPKPPLQGNQSQH